MTRALRRPIRRFTPARSFAYWSKYVDGLAPRHRYMAATAELSGGNTSLVPNSGFAGGSLSVEAGTLAAPAARSGFRNRLVAQFSGSQRLVSSLAASEYRFMHNVCSVFHFVEFSADHTGYLHSTHSIGSQGSGTYRNGPSNTWHVYAGSTQVVATTFSFKAAGSPGMLELTVNTGGFVVRAGRSTIASGALLATADPGDPASTLRLGTNSGGGFPVQMYWAESILFDRVLSAQELSGIHNYAYLNYGGAFV